MAKIRLADDKIEKLNTILMELELSVLERSTAVRIAFAKGIASPNPIDLKTVNGKNGPEIPVSVITKDNESLIKHLIINKLDHSIDHYNFNLLVLAVLERGIEDMYNEIVNLSDAESYVLYLLDKHQKQVT